ncbi:ATP synthase F1 subunit epsilon [Sphingomicrobium astaxanthinifaciens]|uniref:ATP synthase F1 subunit epsilon n=1 Tax=Sphingomicrobium astaxanthinifaciens TaxID=1227949 RepID=UPI001FCACF99|nr:ATP synthase F1 subunit epsilon [Sphingomicrobium astaxanthinifaciens]MCJ7420583.1 ATP synthase F1 subunit epsilon [Sphingomicrobium astaxanthinifaciens]
MALHFELVTPERLERSGEAHMVVVPGVEGDFGVMEGHAPFMTTLKNGQLEIHTSAGGEPERVTVSGGFAEVGANGLTVLTEKVEG